MPNPFDQPAGLPGSEIGPPRPTKKKATNPFDDDPTVVPMGTTPESTGPEKFMRGLLDLAHSAANTATFGASDIIDRKASGRNEFQQQDYNEDIDRRSPIASFAGKAIGLVPAASRVGSAISDIPKVGKYLGGAPSLGSQMMGGAATGTGVDVIDSLLRTGELPSAGSAIMSGLAGGVGGAAATGIARSISPRAKIAAALGPSGLQPEDMQSILKAAQDAQKSGVQLSLPEAAEAAVPGKAASITGRYNSAARTPLGSQASTDFQTARTPGLIDAMRRIAQAPGATTTAGVDSQRAAQGAIDSAKQLVSNSADPYFQSATSKMVAGVPKDKATVAALDKVASDPIVSEALGGQRPHQIGYLSYALDNLDRMLKSASGKKADLISAARDKLQGLMESSSGPFKTGSDIMAEGKKQLVEPLQAGPLGTVAGTTHTGNASDAIFNVRTADEAASAIGAGKRMEAQQPGVVRGLLAGRLQDAAERGPADFQKALPSEHARAVAKEFGGPGMDQVHDLMDTISAVKPDVGQPFSRTPAHGISGLVMHKIMNVGEGKMVNAMNDPIGLLSDKRFRANILKTPHFQDLLRSIGSGPGAQGAARIITGRRDE